MSDIVNQIINIESQLGDKARLIAVSKKQPVANLKAAYDAGFKRFGENYVQELVIKAASLPKDIEWHMIGHLQTNKVSLIAPFISLIHSVDSLRLLKEIDKQALKNNRTIDCLLQVQIAQEETKTGFDVHELNKVIDSNLTQFKNVRITGLMGMSTYTSDEDLISSEFSALKSLFDTLRNKHKELPISELSMGMSGDWPLALEHGSTLLRIGSSIFGSKK